MSDLAYSAKNLKSVAKALNIKGYSTAKKADLLVMLKDYHQQLQDNLDGKLVVPKDVATPESKETPKVEAPKVEAPKEVAAPAPTPRRTAPKTKSVWDHFLADYAKEHGCSIKEAMGKKDEYAKYKAEKAPKPAAQ